MLLLLVMPEVMMASPRAETCGNADMWACARRDAAGDVCCGCGEVAASFGGLKAVFGRFSGFHVLFVVS